MLDSNLSPARVNQVTRSVSPDWYSLGVRPKQAPTDFDQRHRKGSSAAARKAIAIKRTTHPISATAGQFDLEPEWPRLKSAELRAR